MTEFFRASVGAVITDSHGRVLACRRADVDGEAWQLPQGGIERDEDPLAAVYREIEEETGIASSMLELVAVAPDWIAYELPRELRSDKTGLGQTQLWHAFRFRGRDGDIRPNPSEFTACRWWSPEDLLSRTVAFRKPVYDRIFAHFAAMLEQPGARRV